MTPAGLPHSDIHGSRPACGSPWLFAACYVLPRLPAPRHPPCALTALDQSPLSSNPGPPTLPPIALADRNDCISAVAQLPTPNLSKSFSTHFRAELTKIKDPPITVNPISGLALSRIRGRPGPT